MIDFIDAIKEKIVNPIKEMFNYNQGYFSGCIDVVVIRHKQINQCISTQFHVRFGSTKILKPLDSYCHIEINGILQKQIKNMKLGQFGEAYFSVRDPNLNNKKVKRLRLTSEELESMNLQYGMNRVRYIVDSKLQGIQIIEGKIFMYDSQTKFVISDIDGTITKSDVMGHVMSTFNKDWSHPGIAKLFTHIYKQGYQLIYLTARSYSQYDATLELLQRINQDQYILPEGPILMSPDSLGKSFKREVIFKKAEFLKSAILKDLKSLFTIENKVHVQFPFYAGFGNRETDAIAYKIVEIPFSNVYLINPESKIRMLGMKKIENQTYFWLSTTYSEINEYLPIHFPTIQQNNQGDWQKKLIEKHILERMKSQDQINVNQYSGNNSNIQQKDMLYQQDDQIIENSSNDEKFGKKQYSTY